MSFVLAAGTIDPFPQPERIGLRRKPPGAAMLLRHLRELKRQVTGSGVTAESVAQDSNYASLLAALRVDPAARRILGLIFLAVFLLVFGVNAWASTGLYTILVIGTLKSAFIALLGGVAVVYLRSSRGFAKA